MAHPLLPDPPPGSDDSDDSATAPSDLFDPQDPTEPDRHEPRRHGPGRLDDLRHRLGLDLRLVAWGAAALVAALGAAWLLRPSPTPLEETIPTASSVPAGEPAGGPVGGATTTAALTEVVAYAAGAVISPGVYRLDPSARVDDLVRAAGGLAPEADAARLNLAAPLADGVRVYVPRVGEDAPPEVAGPDAPPAPGGPQTGPDEGVPADPIDLNTASETELEELPGVGPAIAASIVGYRAEHGGFSSVDELLEVRGIGEAKLADIRPLAAV